MNLQTLEPQKISEDLLHREFTDILYGLVTTDIKPPYAIALDGLWGMGKTTVLRQIETRLHDAESPVVWFDAWDYQTSSELIVPLLQLCVSQVKENREKVNELRSRLTEQALSQNIEEFKASCFCLFRTLSELYANRPVFFLLDNIERCYLGGLTLLERIKQLCLQMGAPCIILCGIDLSVAKRLIQQRYYGIDEQIAINYFQKLFDLTLAIPQSTNLRNVLREHLNSFKEVLPSQQADALASIISIRGYQIGLSSVRKYLNILTNFCVFLKFNPGYHFVDDFVVNLFLLKEAWQPLYEEIRQEALRERADMGRIIENILSAHENQDERKLTPGQQKFLKDYLGENSPFKDEHLSAWLAEYPTLT